MTISVIVKYHLVLQFSFLFLMKKMVYQTIIETHCCCKVFRFEIFGKAWKMTVFSEAEQKYLKYLFVFFLLPVGLFHLFLHTKIGGTFVNGNSFSKCKRLFVSSSIEHLERLIRVDSMTSLV